MRSNMSRGKLLFLTTLLLLLWGCAGSEVPPTTQGPVSLFLERIQSKHRAEAKQVEVAEPGPTREEIHLRMRPGWEQKPLSEREEDAIILTRTWVKILTQPKGNVTTALAYWLPIEATSIPERAIVRYQDSEGKPLGWTEFRRDRGILLSWIPAS
jgi:hypothetical protein